MVELFGRERSVITKHIRIIFNEGELNEKQLEQVLMFAKRTQKRTNNVTLETFLEVTLKDI
jgi:hypothetical protein